MHKLLVGKINGVKGTGPLAGEVKEARCDLERQEGGAALLEGVRGRSPHSFFDEATNY
ncbi:hypothetical protein MBAV_006299, partial [Candidatus Magnetobacterium bavaricum]